MHNSSKEPGIKDNNMTNDELFKLIQKSFQDLKNELESFKIDVKYQLNSLRDDINDLKKEIANIKYKYNMSIAAQTPPTYMDALSGNSITGGIRSINSHYLD